MRAGKEAPTRLQSMSGCRRQRRESERAGVRPEINREHHPVGPDDLGGNDLARVSQLGKYRPHGPRVVGSQFLGAIRFDEVGLSGNGLENFPVQRGRAHS